MNQSSTHPNKTLSPPQRILMVDDDTNNLLIMLELMKRMNHKVLVAEDGESAIKIAQYHLPDLILLDVVMPEMDGFETCRHLKADEKTKDIPVIFITGLTDEEDIVKGFEVGGLDYITKPFRIKEVEVRISTHLRLRRLVCEMERAKELLEEQVIERTAALAQANQELQAEEAKYRSLTDDVLDTSPVGICVLDKAFKIVWINQALERFFGWRREEVIGREMRRVVQQLRYIFAGPDVFADTVLAAYANNNTIENFVCRVTAAENREERYLEHWSQPIKSGLYADGRIEHYTDITERTRAESELRRYQTQLKELVNQRTAALKLANEQLQAEIIERLQAEQALTTEKNFIESIINTAQVIILVLNKDGRIERFNTYLEQISGYSLPEVQGQNWIDIFRPEHGRDQSRRALVGALSETITNYEKVSVIVTKDKRERQIEWHGEVLKDPGGNVTGVLAIGHDITERLQLEALLRETEKLAATGRMAARIAHEINNPLAGIKNAFMLIQGAVPAEHPYYKYVGLISQEIERIARIVRQMYTLYRPENEAPRKFRLDTIIQEVLIMLEPNCRENQIAFETDLNRATIEMTMVEGLLRQVLYNIIQNAIEASPQGGTVGVNAAVSKEKATIIVSDQGPGIQPENYTAIFEPFFSTKTNRMQAGLGLGLSISKNTVEALGGYLDFESEIGQGTKFQITLPLLSA